MGDWLYNSCFFIWKEEKILQGIRSMQGILRNRWWMYMVILDKGSNLLYGPYSSNSLNINMSVYLHI